MRHYFYHFYKGKINMKRIYYGKNTFYEIFEDYIYIISPDNHNWLKLNTYYLPLIDEIFSRKGKIDFLSMKKTLERSQNETLQEDELDLFLNRLILSNVFYDDIKKLNESKRNLQDKIKNTYKGIHLSRAKNEVYLHLTQRCNFTCWYCYNKSVLNKYEEELTTAQWYKVIGKLKDSKSFIITGGEPLLRKDLLLIIRRIRKLNCTCKISIISNGSLFNESNTKEIFESVDEVLLSLDSLDIDIQKHNRSKKGFNNIIHLLEIASQNIDINKKLVVRSIISKKNYSEILNMTKVLKEKYNITKHIYNEFIPNNQEECDQVFHISQLYNKGCALPMKVNFNEAMDISPSHNRCGAGVSVLAVDSKGNLYPCQTLIYNDDFLICNIFDKDWQKITTESQITKKFLNLTIETTTPCNKCGFKLFCGGGCPSIAFALHGSINTCPEYLCKEYKHSILYRLSKIRVKEL